MLHPTIPGESPLKPPYLVPPKNHPESITRVAAAIRSSRCLELIRPKLGEARVGNGGLTRYGSPHRWLTFYKSFRIVHTPSFHSADFRTCRRSLSTWLDSHTTVCTQGCPS